MFWFAQRLRSCSAEKNRPHETIKPKETPLSLHNSSTMLGNFLRSISKVFSELTGTPENVFMVLSRPHHQHTTHNPFESKKSSLNNIISTILGSLCETVMQRREKWAEWKEKIKKGFRKNSSNYRRPSRAQNCATTREILNFIASQDIWRFSHIHNSKA